MFKPNKKLGQNFLKNKSVVLEMIHELGVEDEDTVIEVGAGLGSLTTEIVNHFGENDIQIKVVEIDIRFIDKLKDVFYTIGNIAVIEANILDWIPRFDSEGRPIRIIGSLPYYITSPIIYEIIKMKQLPEACILLIQKEVAIKISAKAPDSSYISTFVQTFFEVEYLRRVSRKDFSPEPKVDGGIIKLTKRKIQEITDIKKYEGFLRLVYSNPRKMLNKMFTEDERNRSEIDGKLRAQNYDWEKWVKAFTILR